MSEKKLNHAYLVKTENLGLRVVLAPDLDTAKKLASAEVQNKFSVEVIRETTESAPFQIEKYTKRVMYLGKIFLNE